MFVIRKCNPSFVTKKEIKTSTPHTDVSFSQSGTIVETKWEIRLILENTTESVSDVIKLSLPIRMDLIYSTIIEDLENQGVTNLNKIAQYDGIDLREIMQDDKVINIMIDHKSPINTKPYKFFYVEKL